MSRISKSTVPALLALAGLALSQTEKRIVPLDPAQAQTFGHQRKVGVAILVGVAKYPRYSGLSELHYTGRDVDLLDQELTRQRYTVLALKDGEATKGAVLNAIREAGQVLDPQNGTIVFFFSGHGFAEGNANYLATFDATSNNLAQSGLSLSAVEKALFDSGAPRRVMWIDACRNEPGKGAGDARSFARFAGSSGTRILFSTEAGHVSYEDDDKDIQQGLFSYFLVQGLKGEAAREDGLVSFRDLSDYVTYGVKNRSLKQGRLQVPYEGGESSGDFLLAVGTARVPSATAVQPPVQMLVTGQSKKINPKDGATYVWIGPGSFMMGCSPGDLDCQPYEKPARYVAMPKGFWIGQTVVTQEAYERVTKENPSFAGFRGPNLPVNQVSWNDAKSYCQAVGMRLPSESEWEYSARAGSTEKRYGQIDRIGFQRTTSGSRPHEVMGKDANAWGLYDVIGSVWQWMSDSFPTGKSFALRGGSWGSTPNYLRVSGHTALSPTSLGQDIGFRCAGDSL